MLRFSFKEAPTTIKNAKKAKPQVIGEAIHRLAEEHGGKLRPQHAVEAARNAHHVLHQHFEWNDKVAANSHRLEQARELIRLIRVVDTDDAKQRKERRAFISVTDKGGTSYRNVAEVMESTQLQLRVLEQAERDLRAWESRYEDLTEICGMVRAAREHLTKTIDRTRTEARPQ